MATNADAGHPERPHHRGFAVGLVVGALLAGAGAAYAVLAGSAAVLVVAGSFWLLLGAGYAVRQLRRP